jgi:hypothetical protein
MVRLNESIEPSSIVRWTKNERVFRLVLRILLHRCATQRYCKLKPQEKTCLAMAMPLNQALREALQKKSAKRTNGSSPAIHRWDPAARRDPVREADDWNWNQNAFILGKIQSSVSRTPIGWALSPAVNCWASAPESASGRRGESPLQAYALRPVTECNCDTAMCGGEQQEVNDNELDSAGSDRGAC